MIVKNLLFAMSSAGLLLAAIAGISDQPVQAKASKAYHAQRGAYLVPPPPPYQPSVLPEYSITGAGASAPRIASAEKPVCAYSKYIYVRNSADAPRMVQSNKGVTQWTKPE